MRRRLSDLGLISLAILVFAGVLAAQEPPAPQNPPDQGADLHGKPGRANIESRLESLSRQLNLTDGQKQKIRSLLRHEANRVKEIHENSNLTQRQAQRKTALVRRQTNQRIAQVLTPEQVQQWQEARLARHGGSKAGRAEPGG
jgi:Spy/CpxP family protein refolding chaperone